jgi:hypothetical protein
MRSAASLTINIRQAKYCPNREKKGEIHSE